MKTLKSKWLLSSVAASALVLGSQAAMAGIAGSQHDFTPTGRAQGGGLNGGSTGNSAEICAFCHTPHAADESFVGAPLWNKQISGGGASYTRYSALNTATLDGAEVAVGSVSLACLSCHDGSQAMDVVVNAPGQGLGSGTYDPNNSIGAMTAGGINAVALLGTDLRDDHPISIEYGGVASNSWPASPTTGSTFDPASVTTADPDFFAVEAAVKNGVVSWYFDDQTANNRIDKNEIRLYTRNAGTNNAGYVECGSCHDPHNTKENYGGGDNTVQTDGSVVDFLRSSNANSAICLTCHDK